MFDGMGRAIGGMVLAIMIMTPLSVLGIWKLIEIIAWVWQNVSIVIGGR